MADALSHKDEAFLSWGGMGVAPPVGARGFNSRGLLQARQRLLEIRATFARLTIRRSTLTLEWPT
jgi:hypothetical protein